MVARVIPVDPFDLVVFGATGDLARRKILPALWQRFAEGQMPPEARIIGAARTEQSAADFRQMVSEAFDEFMGDKAPDPAARADFLERLDYVAVEATGDEGWAELASKLRDGVVRAFYFRSDPRFSARWPRASANTAWSRPRRGSWWKSPSATIWKQRAP